MLAWSDLSDLKQWFKHLLTKWGWERCWRTIYWFFPYQHDWWLLLIVVNSYKPTDIQTFRQDNPNLHLMPLTWYETRPTSVVLWFVSFSPQYGNSLGVLWLNGDCPNGQWLTLTHSQSVFLSATVHYKIYISFAAAILKMTLRHSQLVFLCLLYKKYPSGGSAALRPQQWVKKSVLKRSYYRGFALQSIIG